MPADRDQLASGLLVGELQDHFVVGNDAGEHAAVRGEEAVPAEALTAALYTRFRSRQDHTFAEKVLSAMRAGFGGHAEPIKRPI